MCFWCNVNGTENLIGSPAQGYAFAERSVTLAKAQYTYIEGRTLQFAILISMLKS